MTGRAELKTLLQSLRGDMWFLPKPFASERSHRRKKKSLDRLFFFYKRCSLSICS
jgi:hypothetical protein